MDHIKFASTMGALTAFTKFALENPRAAKDKSFLDRHRKLLAILAGGGLIGGGALAANQGVFGPNAQLGSKMDLSQLNPFKKEDTDWNSLNPFRKDEGGAPVTPPST